ncbi:MAG: hypothetical protein ACI8WB_004434 [Phenylobacterium sp.]|jgi:hypothetical protein
MDKKTLSLTLLAGVVVGGIGIAISQSQQGTVDLDNPLVLPELAAKASELNHIRIESAGNQLVVDSEKQQDKWVINNLGGYHADTVQLAKLINALKDAHKVEAKTSKPTLFHHLGVRDLTDAQSKAVLISLSTGGDKEYQLLVGDDAKNGKGQYVRLVGDNQTWLIDKTITKPEKAVDWVDSKLFDFTLEDIRSVKLSGQHEYIVSKADKDKDNFELDAIADTHQLKYDSVLDALPRGIASMSFEQLMPAADWKTSLAGNSQTLVVTLFAGESADEAEGESKGVDKQITLILAKADDKHYAHLKGDNPLWANWVYEISENTYSQLVKDKEAFLDKKVVDEPAPEVQG